jgi:hypothetical protein
MSLWYLKFIGIALQPIAAGLGGFLPESANSHFSSVNNEQMSRSGSLHALLLGLSCNREENF